jgi:hypothetical protein
MYRCKDCGKEYKEKVDYCDCGNNTFDYTEDFVPSIESIKSQKQSQKPLSVEQKSEIISWIFFVLCIILSLIVWLIPIKVEQTAKEDVKEQKVDVKNIPNLEKIWNSTPPKVEVKQEEKPKTLLDTFREDIPDRILPKPIDIKQPVQNKQNKYASNSKPTTQSKPVVQNKSASNQAQNKSTSQNKQTTQQNKPVVQNNVSTLNKPVQQTPKQSTNQPQNKQISNPNNLKPAQNQKTQNSVQNNNKPIEKPKSVYNPDNLEMLKYKGSLRSALFAKLPIGSVQGSGSCSVQFAVDKTGKLINRGFSKQSNNKSLNDAVYYMLMSVPRFAAPPEGYNQELIRMNININSDGSYEISIN